MRQIELESSCRQNCIAKISLLKYWKLESNYKVNRIHLLKVIWLPIRFVRVIDCCLMPSEQCLQLHVYHGENKLHLMKQWWCPFCTRLTRSLSCLVLAHWINSPQDMFLYLDKLIWFWANQSFLILFNAAYLMGKQQIPI